MVALALELTRRGHDVLVLGLEKYQETITQHPRLRYAPYTDTHIWAFASSLGQPGAVDRFPFLAAKYLNDSGQELLEQYVRLAREFGADALVGQYVPMSGLTVFTVAQALRKPLLFVLHDPLSAMPNAAYSYDPTINRIEDHGWIPNLLNARALGLLAGIINTIHPASHWRQLRAAYNLTTPYPWMEALEPRTLASIPCICTWNPTLWPRPSDFSPHWHVTGFFETIPLEHGGGGDTDTASSHQDPAIAWHEARKAARRAEGLAERPLLHFALGSFDHHNRTAFTEILLDTLETLGMDAVAAPTTVDDRAMPASVLVLKEMDHGLLFPRCAVVVHHGGAGTLAQCIRSGRPGVCIPAMHFQAYGCARLESIGAGRLLLQPAFMAAWAAGRNLLTEAVRQVLEPAVVARARELSIATEQSGGVKLGAQIMLGYLGNLSLAHEKEMKLKTQGPRGDDL
jgi:hypothetical protein